MARTRLLVVDDDLAFLDSVCASLQFAGYEVYTAPDGPEALDKAERLVPDGILLDIRMPGLDGYEVCQGLKGNPVTQPIPVIFVTAAQEGALQQRAAAVGGAGYLTKPFGLEALTELVAAILEGRKAEGVLQEAIGGGDAGAPTTRPDERRRMPRLTLPEPATGEVMGRTPVQILDLSLGGARLEHTAMLRPGDVYVLRLVLQERSFTLRGRIAWSRVIGRTGDGDESTLIYQSGAQFEELSDDVRNALAAFLEELSRPCGPGSPDAEEAPGEK